MKQLFVTSLFRKIFTVDIEFFLNSVNSLVSEMNEGFLYTYNLDVCRASDGQCTCNSCLSLYMRAAVTHTSSCWFRKFNHLFFSPKHITLSCERSAFIHQLSFSYRSISHYTAIRTKSAWRQLSKQDVHTDKVNWKANDRTIEEQQVTYSYSVLDN
jgi:hypothetical protein